MLTEGMVKLGLLKGEPAELIKEEKYKQFYMHGLGICWASTCTTLEFITTTSSRARSSRVW